MNWAHLKVFGWLLWRDLVLIKRTFISKSIDGMIWSFNSILISTYIFPLLGMPTTYGSFIWVGTIVTLTFFESFAAADQMIRDMEDNRQIEYLLTIPLAAPLVLLNFVCYFALDGLVLSALLLPLGKIVLLNNLDLSNFSLLKFLILWLLSNTFFGIFAVWVVGWAPSSLGILSLRRRLQNPLWNFGGSQFPWLIFYQALPALAYITLANPVTYAFEGMRAAVLGQDGFINFWLCALALIIFIIIFGTWALQLMKKKLDYV
jgi:ABC-2 type transport system permease protein